MTGFLPKTINSFAPVAHKPFSFANITRHAPTIDISADRKDLSKTNLSLADLQKLYEEIESNSFIGHIVWGTLPSGEEAHILQAKIEAKIIENNQKHRRYPSDFVFGLLSKHAYETAKAGEVVTFTKEADQHYNPYLTDWRVHSVFDLSDNSRYGRYYGVCYYNVQTRQMVLAHRGTNFISSDVLSVGSPWRDDFIGVFKGAITEQQKFAYGVTKEIAEFARDNHYHFSVTGHSLGAWLAELSVYYSVFEFGVNTKATTFDSPGSIKMADLHPNIVNHANARDIRDLDITTYLSDPNFVNTCHRHVGQVYRLYPEYEKSKALPLIGKLRMSEHPGFRSFHGHSLDPLVATFDPSTGKPYPGKVEIMTRWPVMTYIPQQKLGRNLINEALVLPNRSIPADTALTMLSGKDAIDSKQENLIISFVRLVADALEGRIDQTQYLHCWAQLSTVGTAGTSSIDVAMNEFSWQYESSYEFSARAPGSDQLGTYYKGSVDWYLKKLNDCPWVKITQAFGENSLISHQLQHLKSQYKVTPEQGRFHLIATGNLPVEALRENILRLLDEHITHGEVRKFLETHQQKPWSQANLASYLPLSLGEQYILRKEDFDQLDQILAHHPYVIISGEAGFGKSSLAIEYGHQQTKNPQSAKIVVTIDADSPEEIDTAYRVMAKQLGIRTEQENTETLRVLVHSQINISQKKVLLIFDNVEKAEHITPVLAHLPTNIQALITTRHTRLIEGKPTLKIRPFSHEEAKQYIHSSEIKARIKKEEEVDALIAYYAKETEEVIPYHLNRAIGIIKQKRTGGITKYLDKVREQPDQEGEVFLQRQLMDKSPYAWPMLQYAAFLDPDFINLTIFENILGVDREALDEAISALESLSAMQALTRDEQEGLSLHRLTQASVKSLMGNPSHQAIGMTAIQIREKLVQSLNALCPTVDNSSVQTWSQAKKLMPHIEKILTNIQETDNLYVAELLTKSGAYARCVLGWNQKAHDYYQKALILYQKLYSTPDPLLASSLNNYGMSHLYMGKQNNIEQALTSLEEALAMWQALYPHKDSPEIAKALHDVGLAHSILGLKDSAHQKKGISRLEEALVMRQQLYAGVHEEVAYSLNDLGMAFAALSGDENKEKGHNYKKQALAMRQLLYPEQSHPTLAYSLHEVGLSYENSGKISKRAKGLKMLQQALTMWRNIYTTQPHPRVASSLDKVGTIYTKSDEVIHIKEGLKLLHEALDMWKYIYRNQPRKEIVDTFEKIANALIKLEKKEEGQSYLRQAEEMRQKLNQESL